MRYKVARLKGIGLIYKADIIKLINIDDAEICTPST